MPATFDAYFTVMDERLLSVMGEECTYYPAAGDSRTVTACVDQSALLREGTRSVNALDELHVLVMRDADHATYGGISTPQLGDAFTREGSEDRFSYQGIKQEVSTTAWVLTFIRGLPYEVGGHRR